MQIYQQLKTQKRFVMVIFVQNLAIARSAGRKDSLALRVSPRNAEKKMSSGWIKTTVVGGFMVAGVGLAQAAPCGGTIGPGAVACETATGASLSGGFRTVGFTDFYNFQLTTATTVSGNASADNSNSLINPLTVAIFTGVDGSGSLLTSATGVGAVFTTFVLLDPGFYSVRIEGTPPAAGASYAGSLNLAPVPLPGALVLFGSGVVGLVALGKRRKKQLAAA